jgi:xylose dehydrogenase (NAD/NADP)
MLSEVQWGILSTAAINDALIGPMNTAKKSRLTAVASRDRARAKEYASRNNIPKYYGSYWELLSDTDIDAVYISLPNTLHYEWIVNAANEKKHVLCEKPLVTEIEQIEKLKSVEKDTGVTIFEAFMYLHHPQTKKLLEIIKSGRIGKVQYIVSWLDYFLPFSETDNIRLKPELGGGSLWDVGVYTNSFSIVFAGGEIPSEVTCYQTYGETGVDTSTYAQMKFPNGTIAQFSASIRAPFRVGAHIVGESGGLIVDDPWKPGLDGKNSIVTVLGKEGQRETIIIPAYNPYQAEVETMVTCIIDGSTPTIPLSLSAQFLTSITALKKSANTGTVLYL